MKNFKKVLALVLAVVMLLSFATVASAKIVTSEFYEDVDDIDYKEAVDVLGAIGVLEGYPDDTFRPDNTITRAEAAKIIAMFDNGSSSINGLYASANPFSDCVGNWAESFIAYCAKTGIIAGMGGDKFAPSEKVTGVQFLKMVLVVLGYDAKAEGLEGKNWDVNTLALAKRVGLTATLGVKFDYSAYLKRQEAAVIMLDALRADTVVYGNALGANVNKLIAEIDKFIKNFDEDNPYEAFAGLNVNGVIYVTVVGAVKTGDKLMKDWGLKEGYTSDAFYRPYRTWTLDGVGTIGKYMFPVQAEYTTAVNACELLVDLGVAKTDRASKRGVEGYYVDGAVMDDYTVDVLKHTSSQCGMEGIVYGGQGTLTQVFYMPQTRTYRITEISTWLGQVHKVQKASTMRDEHLKGYNQIWIEGFWNEEDADADDFTWATNDTFVAGEYVLLTYSYRADGDTDPTLESAYDSTPDLQSVKHAKAEAGILSGLDNNYRVKVDNTWIPAAKNLDLGYTGEEYVCRTHDWDSDDSVKLVPENLNTKLVFLYDVYGNVIGVVDEAPSALNYTVIDWMYLIANEGHGILKANLVGLDATMTKAATVESIFAPELDGEWAGTFPVPVFGPEYGYNWWPVYDHLFTYTVNEDGEYALSIPEAVLRHGAIADGNNAYGIAIVKDKAYVYGTFNGAVNTDVKFAVLNDDTQILVHEMDGTYTAATGKDVGTIYASNVEIVMDAAEEFAEIIYLYGGEDGYVYRESSKNNGFVAIEYDQLPVMEKLDGIEVCPITVYFDGKATEIYVSWADYTTIVDEGVGFYTFKFTDKLKDGKVLCEVMGTVTGMMAGDAVEVLAYAGTTIRLGNGKDLKVLPDVKLYDVDLDKGVISEITDGELTSDQILYITNANGVVTVIYCLYTEKP